MGLPADRFDREIKNAMKVVVVAVAVGSLCIGVIRQIEITWLMVVEKKGWIWSYF